MSSKLKHQHIDRITHNTLQQVLEGIMDELLDQGYTPSEIKAYISEKIKQSSEYLEKTVASSI